MHFRIVMSNIMKAKTVITESCEFDFGKTVTAFLLNIHCRSSTKGLLKLIIALSS